VLKFLIDECLTLDLVEVAKERGFPESSHVVWMGKAGWKDWELKIFILDDDWTFVTRNSVDFRGSSSVSVRRSARLTSAVVSGYVIELCWRRKRLG
jgi:hypothetical protein